MHRVGLANTVKDEVGECRIYLDYLKRLDTLTSGSKPLITSLTLSAQTQSYNSDSIVRAIEDKLQKVEPSLKLPLLYLIDSIIKNIGGTYISGFQANILNVFLKAYKEVQADQREKLERVLATWSNSQIFPDFILDRIDETIKDIKEQESAPPKSTVQVHVNPKFVVKAEQLEPATSTNKPVIGDKRHNPSTEEPDRHRGFVRPPPPRPSIQSNFENRVSDYPSPRKNQPRTFGPGRNRPYEQPPYFPSAHNKRFPERPPRNFSPRPEFFHNNRSHNFEPHVPRHHYERPQYYNRPHSPHYEQPRPFHGHRSHFNPNGANFSPNHFGNGPRTPPYPTPHSFHRDHMGPPMGGPPGEHHHLNGPELHSSSFPHMPGFTAPSPMNGAPGDNLGVDPNLIKNLIESGIINLNSGPALPFHPQHPILPDVEPLNETAPGFNVSSLAALEDTQSVTPPVNVAPPPNPLSVSLTQKDINLRREGAVKGLYDDLSLQCRQCGLRYPAGEASQAKLDAHMDWHFRQNRKKKERAASRRFLSRAWFSTDEDWAAGKVTEFDYQNEPAFFNKTAKPQTEIAQVIAKLEKSTVVVPADHAGQACPICQDKFTSCWSDEQEEWIYKNAVIVDKQVCHATCHADHRSLTKAPDSPVSEESLKDNDGFKKRPFPEMNEPNLMV